MLQVGRGLTADLGSSPSVMGGWGGCAWLPGAGRMGGLRRLHGAQCQGRGGGRKEAVLERERDEHDRWAPMSGGVKSSFPCPLNISWIEIVTE
jgi:hypothetical protein